MNDLTLRSSVKLIHRPSNLFILIHNNLGLFQLLWTCQVMICITWATLLFNLVKRFVWRGWYETMYDALRSIIMLQQEVNYKWICWIVRMIQLCRYKIILWKMIRNTKFQCHCGQIECPCCNLLLNLQITDPTILQ